MSLICINKWYGRFGNNCIQLANAVYLAQELGIRRVKYPPHNMLRNKIIDSGANHGSHPGLAGIFFRDCSLRSHVLPMSVQRKKRIFLDSLLPELNQRNDLGHTMRSLLNNDSTLVIHIRSGDVFNAKPHPGYVQPPLCYYQTIIECSLWTNIYLVCEDTRNPVIDRLCCDYPIISKHQSTLAKDFSLLCNAKNLVGSYGTFAHAAFYFNPVIRRYWIPGYMKSANELASAFSNVVNVIKFTGYINVGDWKNTTEQRQLMLEYKGKT